MFLPDTFSTDATFLLRKDIWIDATLTFQGVTSGYENYNIRHVGSALRIEPYEDSDSYKQDASYLGKVVVHSYKQDASYLGKVVVHSYKQDASYLGKPVVCGRSRPCYDRVES